VSLPQIEGRRRPNRRGEEDRHKSFGAARRLLTRGTRVIIYRERLRRVVSENRSAAAAVSSRGGVNPIAKGTDESPEA